MLAQQTLSVAVGPWNGEPAVFAANGIDGIAIRDTSGQWTRYSLDYSANPGHQSRISPTSMPSNFPEIDEQTRFTAGLIALGLAVLGLAIAAGMGLTRHRAREARRTS